MTIKFATGYSLTCTILTCGTAYWNALGLRGLVKWIPLVQGHLRHLQAAWSGSPLPRDVQFPPGRGQIRLSDHVGAHYGKAEQGHPQTHSKKTILQMYFSNK